MICQQSGQVRKPGLRAQRRNLLPPRLEETSELSDDVLQSLSLVERLSAGCRAEVLRQGVLPCDCLVRNRDTRCIMRALNVHGLQIEGLEDLSGWNEVVRVVSGCVHVRFGI